ncbi:uncharacterized protein LOC110596967 isoform X2 [Ictidomys tridecemlineatus]
MFTSKFPQGKITDSSLANENLMEIMEHNMSSQWQYLQNKLLCCCSCKQTSQSGDHILCSIKEAVHHDVNKWIWKSVEAGILFNKLLAFIRCESRKHSRWKIEQRSKSSAYEEETLDLNLFKNRFPGMVSLFFKAAALIFLLILIPTLSFRKLKFLFWRMGKCVKPWESSHQLGKTRPGDVLEKQKKILVGTT